MSVSYSNRLTAGPAAARRRLALRLPTPRTQDHAAWRLVALQLRLNVRRAGAAGQPLPALRHTAMDDLGGVLGKARHSLPGDSRLGFSLRLKRPLGCAAVETDGLRTLYDVLR
jgi:hypothetical protein